MGPFEPKGVDLGIEGYSAGEEVGRGGFGIVYRAREPELSRDVAIKILTVAQFDELDDVTRRRFERERGALGALSDHPNIVTVYRTGTTLTGDPYLAMEYLPGGTLREHYGPGGLEWHRAVGVGVKICGALETAHRRGVVHRDIKPENILVSGFGEPLLSDFGVAVIQGGAETRSGVITASIHHAAPEILSGERPTVRSDVYSHASTMHNLLTGQPPFYRASDETLIQLISRIASEPVPDLRPLGIPEDVVAVIERGMAKDPSVRFASAEAMGRAFQDAQRAAGRPVTAMTVRADASQSPVQDATGDATVVPPARPPVAGPLSSRPWWRHWWVAAASVVLLLGAGRGVLALVADGASDPAVVEPVTTVPATTEPTAAETVPALAPPLPDFVGGSRDAAYDWLSSNGLGGLCCTPAVGDESAAVYSVLQQGFPPGAELPLGTVVEIVSHDPGHCAGQPEVCVFLAEWFVTTTTAAPEAAPANRAPELSGIGSRIDEEDVTIDITAIATDVDGDTLAFSASGLPVGLSISSSGRISGRLGAEASGEYQVTLSVSDGASPPLTDSVSFSWTVQDTHVVMPTIYGTQSTSPATSLGLGQGFESPVYLEGTAFVDGAFWWQSVAPGVAVRKGTVVTYRIYDSASCDAFGGPYCSTGDLPPQGWPGL